MRGRVSALTLPVEATAGAEFRGYAGRTPVFTVNAGQVMVSLTLPERLRTEHVQFARSLAEQATAYAVEVERLFRGLPSGKAGERRAA
jgi:hypothetical protein